HLRWQGDFHWLSACTQIVIDQVACCSVDKRRQLFNVLDVAIAQRAHHSHKYVLRQFARGFAVARAYQAHYENARAEAMCKFGFSRGIAIADPLRQRSVAAHPDWVRHSPTKK